MVKMKKLIMDSSEPDYIVDELSYCGVRPERRELKCYNCECGAVYDDWLKKCPVCGKRPDSETTRERIADYLVVNEKNEVVKAVERKADDLYSSVLTNKIYIQAEKLSSAYGCRAMIATEVYLEMLEEEYPKMRYRFQALPSEMMDSYGIMFWQAGSNLRLVRYLAKCLEKSDTIPKVRYEIKDRMIALKQLRALGEIPGIGPKIGEKLWKLFGSILGIASLSVEELMIVPGIGEKKSTSIYEFFRKGFPWKKKKSGRR